MNLREDFQFPSSYMEMSRNGWFDGKRFKSRDDFNQDCIWFCEMAWLSFKQIVDYQYEDYQSTSIVPFALNRAGDIWGWHLDYKNKDCLPIVLCYHDDDEGLFYAPSFEAALFRHILEFASQNNFCLNSGESWEMDLQTAQQHISNWKNKFASWFKSEWLLEIERFMTLELKLFQVKNKPSTGDYYTLISPMECNELVEKYIGFDQLNETFIWTI